MFPTFSGGTRNLLLGEEDALKIEAELTLKLNIQSKPAAPIPSNTAATRVDIPPRYAQLETLLRDRKWREADRETYLLMITTVGKVEGQWFARADLENFPCEDLKILDQLWLQHSKTDDCPDGKWGFSVQKRIWQECGSPMDFSDDWLKFCVRVGWRVNNEWRDYDDPDLTFDPEKSLPGEFPFWLLLVVRLVGWGGGLAGIVSSLAQRLVDCSSFEGSPPAPLKKGGEEK